MISHFLEPPTLNLDFLKEATYDVLIYADSSEGKVMTLKKQIHTRKGLQIEMIKNGGFGVKFSLTGNR